VVPGYALTEGPSNVDIASVLTRVVASGAFSAFETTVLLTVEEMLNALGRRRALRIGRPTSTSTPTVVLDWEARSAWPATDRGYRAARRRWSADMERRLSRLVPTRPSAEGRCPRGRRSGGRNELRLSVVGFRVRLTFEG
jgi:hypothetical protein